MNRNLDLCWKQARLGILFIIIIIIYFNWFKKGCFDVSFLTSMCVNNYFETEESKNCLAILGVDKAFKKRILFSSHEYFVDWVCSVWDKAMVSFLR